MMAATRKSIDQKKSKLDESEPSATPNSDPLNSNYGMPPSRKFIELTSTF